MWITIGIMALTAVAVYVVPKAAVFVTLALPVTIFQATRYWVKAARKRGREVTASGEQRANPAQIVVLGLAVVALVVGILIRIHQ